MLYELNYSASKEINDYIESLNMTHNFLKNYQYIIYQYFMSKYYKDKDMLLLWLSVGRGKTLLSIVCGIAGIRSGMFDKIIILSPKSVQDEFVKNLMLYCLSVFYCNPASMTACAPFRNGLSYHFSAVSHAGTYPKRFCNWASYKELG